jgi:hypothetical protein
MPGYAHVRKDCPDNHRGGGLCAFLANDISFFHLQNLTTQISKLNGFYLNLIAFPE